MELGLGKVVCAGAFISNGVKVGKGYMFEGDVTISRDTVI